MTQRIVHISPVQISENELKYFDMIDNFKPALTNSSSLEQLRSRIRGNNVALTNVEGKIVRVNTFENTDIVIITEIYSDTTWELFIQHVLDAIKQNPLVDPTNLLGIALSPEPIWTHRGYSSRIIDTRENARSPFDVLKDNVTIYIVMVSRQVGIWKPLVVGISICRQCLRQSSEVPLMYCMRCHDAMYCSKECQRKNWKIHKKTCVSKDSTPNE